MVGLLPPDIGVALRSLRDTYKRRRDLLSGQPGAHASAGLGTVDRLIATVDRAIATGEAPIASLSSALRSSGKLLSHPVAHLSRGEMVRLLGISSTPGGPKGGGWWQVASRSGASGWLDRKEIFPDPPAALSSKAGTASPGRQPDEIELGVRDTMIR
jgi:hypothetical protein